jgi:hypothetical protein
MFDPVQPVAETRPDLLFLRMLFHFHKGVPDHHPKAAWPGVSNMASLENPPEKWRFDEVYSLEIMHK